MEFCPYKGLQPYTENDRKYFFGREREESVIASNLYTAPLTVLYGASGVGKSSVLLAAVVPRLKKDPQVVPVVFRTWQQGSYQVSLKNEVIKALEQKIGKSASINPALPLDDFLLECDRLLPFRGRILFIFDQFEEYFLGPDGPGLSNGFDAELARAVNRREIPVNFLLSMRDDGLSKLDRFQGRIPNLMSNLLRVKHLRLQDAARAIRKPLEVYNAEVSENQQMGIEDALVSAVAERARPEKRVEPGVAPGGSLDVVVETPVLQILLTRLWKAEKELKSNTLRLKTFENLGGAEHIVFGYLEDVMNSLTDDERNIAARIFPFLLTPEKTKTPQAPSSLASWTKLRPSEAESLLNRLSAREDKILRRVEVSGQPARYEIFHDVLGAPIHEWCEKFSHQRDLEEAERRAKEAAEAGAKEAERQLRIEQAEALAKKEGERARVEGERAEAQERLAILKTRSNRRMRWFSLALVGISILALAAALFAVIQSARAKLNEQRATESARQEAKQRELADKALAEAERQKGIAIDNAQKEAAQRKTAENATAEAEKQKTLALEAVRKESEQTNAAEAARDQAEQQRVLADQSAVKAAEQSRIASFARSLAESMGGRGSAVSPDGRLFAFVSDTVSGANSLTLHIQETATGKELVSFSNIGLFASPKFSPDGSHVAALSQDGRVFVWSTAQPRSPRVELQAPIPDAARAINRIAFSPDGKLILTGGDKWWRIWDLRSGEALSERRSSVNSQAAAFSPDQKLIAFGDFNGSVEFWDVATGSARFCLEYDYSERNKIPNIEHLIFLPDGRTIIVEGDGKVQFWEVETKNCVGCERKLRECS